MKTIEKSNGSLTLAQPANGRNHTPMPDEFTGLNQAGYEAGFASGRESGYRQGYEAGFGDGRRQDVGSTAAPAPSRTPPKVSPGWASLASSVFPVPSAEG